MKNPFSQIKNTKASPLALICWSSSRSSRLEQVEDTISELEYKIEVKEKTEVILVKQHKSCERNMQDLSNSIKRSNLRIMSIEGEEVQAKRIHNIFNKIIENFPNLKKVFPIQVQEALRAPNRPDQNRISSQHIIIKTTSIENRERILKAVREKKTQKTNSI
jgi:hypothetical protein